MEDGGLGRTEATWKVLSPGGGKNSGERLESLPPVSLQDFQASSLVCSLRILPSAPWHWEGVGEPTSCQLPAGLELLGGGGRYGESWAHGAALQWLLIPS